MKKIVIDARGFNGPHAEYVQNLVKQLDIVDNNLSHRFVIVLKPKDMDSWEPKSKRFTKVSSRFGAFTWAEQFGFAWQLYKLKPDLVHFTAANQPILYFKKKVTTIQDLNILRFRSQAKHKLATWIKHQRKLLTYKFAMKSSSVIISPSDFMKEDVAKYTHTNSRKIVVTPEAAEPINSSPTPNELLREAKFILYLGRPAIHKNLGALIEAFTILRQKNPDLKLVLAGKKDNLYKNFERLVGKQNLDDHVLFTNFVTDGELKWLYQNCSAFVVPYLSEGFGVAGLEAMQEGAPVVSSNYAALPETYGNAAEYFDPTDPNEMATKIQKVINNEQLQKDLRALGKKQASKYSWERMASQTLAVYKTVLKED